MSKKGEATACPDRKLKEYAAARGSNLNSAVAEADKDKIGFTREGLERQKGEKK